MKLSENWLRTFCNPPLGTRELADALTFGGVEVEEIDAAAPAFERVVVGEVLSVDKHPGPDRLSVCQVSVGVAPLTIVCGAPNVKAGMKVPTALVGAKLPGIEIKAAKVRGVESQGMLCSEKELGLSAESAGLMALPADSVIGANVRDVLELDDWVLTTKPTPNRGDCLSILGMGRELAAVTGAPLEQPPTPRVIEAHSQTLPVTLEAPDACPRYCGRLVCGVDAQAPTPRWMVTRLERSGLRSISAVVDITNYVMLELGQPLHAFDAAKLDGGIRVRLAREAEKLELLNGETPALDRRYLVIADDRKAVALAGIMGGAPTAVSESTREIFLESAFFAPDVIAGKSRLLGFGSDSSFRFERGVDYGATRLALDRATELVLEICGGEAGPISEASASLPARVPVALRMDRAARVIGIEIPRSRAQSILKDLGFVCEPSAAGFLATPPSYRFDISLEEDLIEELARIHGYDRIPAAAPVGHVRMLPETETVRPRAHVRARLARLDYHEAVTYSFIDREWEADFCGNEAPVALANPIASQMSVMRSSLVPGLVMAVAFNARHKQTRVRLFEIGRCFQRAGEDYAQPVRVGAVAYGEAVPEQWAEKTRRVDFYDVKGDIEALLAPSRVELEAAAHPALHPGKSARIRVNGREAGWIGEIHPRWQQKYDLPSAPVVFEVEYDLLAACPLPAYGDIAKVPPVRRDVAALFDESVPHGAVIAALRAAAPTIVTEIRLFDLYRGRDLPKGKKSLAFMVLLQDTRKTLTDAEVEAAVSEIRETLLQRFDAKLR
ncbi:MAG TPA: phenylalanine--tRNA ligase subunit beta [Burkholderiales bacterium]|nr:phenylalanine--tRNA ligase subunit beta [Burkholderiales bacterium]